jgi:hypothetical protein
MVDLTELLTEIMRLILGALADVDLKSVLASRRTCKAFQAIVTDILNTPADHGIAIHAFIFTHFSSVLDTSTVQLQYQPDPRHPYTPFAALPWASNLSTRGKWVREEASWRQLPLVSPLGNLVQRLQTVHANQCYSAGATTNLTGGYVAFREAAEEEEFGYIERPSSRKA